MGGRRGGYLHNASRLQQICARSRMLRPSIRGARGRVAIAIVVAIAVGTAIIVMVVNVDIAEG